ncbi:hypothetical protein MA16_Dca014225 [Dendrobium catenatum]|uniref:DUF4283 domain-containing protein n=1 Tax=Dendrobium catenatum TaxID=906689 RepID=A0A2I0VZB6_9ASPA|nr:hypothetical protein MA16_Dca014225 [Dendrobium catenatum]
MAPIKLRDPGFFGGISHSKSFLQALAGSSSSFPDLRPSTFRGLPSLWVSDEEIRDLAVPFRFSLVGFFPSKRPPLDAIRKFFFNLKLNGEVSVTVLDSTHILIKLSNDLDYCRVFCHRSYMVFNCFMKLTKWSPTLDIGVESPIIPIWISFPHLRPHFFAPRILFGLGELFGKPLKIDEATSVGSRPSNARVLVEIDITKTYTKQVWLGSEAQGYVQDVIFDEFPHFCSVCKCLGHVSGKCKSDSSFGKPAIVIDPVEILPAVGVVNDDLDISSVPENVANVLVNSEMAGVDLLTVEPEGDSPADGLVPVNLGISVGVNNCQLLASEEGFLKADAGDCVLSHKATPFFPSGNGLLNVSDLAACNLEHLAAVSVAVPPTGSEISPVMGGVVENGGLQVSKNLESGTDGGVPVVCVGLVDESTHLVSVERLSSNNNLVVVPVNEVDVNEMATCMGNSSVLTIRKHGDWLVDSSDPESESDLNISDNDFVLGCNKNVATRGKFWGRGRRRR